MKRTTLIKISLILLFCAYIFVILGAWGKPMNNRPHRGLNLHSAFVGDRYPEADFLCFWAASSLALAGKPASVYTDQIKSVEASILGKEQFANRPWFYPPTFLLMVLPLALLPFYWSLIIWSLTTFTGYLFFIRRIAPGSMIFWLALTFPGAFQNFIRGQNAFLSTLLLGGGLFLLDHHPFTAGLLLGLISYKPQLAILVPIALCAGRYWRALLGAMVSGTGLLIMSLVSFGYEPWIYFWKHISTLPFHSPGSAIKYMPTLYYAAQALGISSGTAIIIHKLFMVIILLTVVIIWYNRPSFFIRASTLIICILLFTPYCFLYDWSILIIPLVLLAKDNYEYALSNYEKFIWIACWVFPLFPSVTYIIKIQMGPILLAAFLLIIIYRYLCLISIIGLERPNFSNSVR